MVSEERFDAVIVDEGRDCRPAWWAVAPQLLRDPARGHLWVFWDPHENIFTGEANVAERLGLPNYQLSLNCHNSRPIACSPTRWWAPRRSYARIAPDTREALAARLTPWNSQTSATHGELWQEL